MRKFRVRRNFEEEALHSSCNDDSSSATCHGSPNQYLFTLGIILRRIALNFVHREYFGPKI